MKQKQLILCGAALSLGMFGYGVTIGSEPPKVSEKQGASAKEADLKKAKAAPELKPSVYADAKPATKDAEKKPDEQPMSADEKAIRATGETYVKAYCEADAKSIAALFTVDAEYIDEGGNVHQGREAIEKSLKAVFDENPGAKIDVDIQTIRIVSPGVAIEDGTTAFTSSDDSDPIYSRYTAVHVKTNGTWLAASVREHAPKDRRQHRTQLEQLAWLQGDWVDEGEESVVIFSCSPADGGNFLLRSFVIQIAGQDAMSGTQRIGWDPACGKLRSWIFDSEGGYSDGYWHRNDDNWVLKSTGVTADGQTASDTSIYTLVNDDTMTWQSVDREIAGVALPDSEPVTIVRRAPLPELIHESPLTKLK